MNEQEVIVIPEEKPVHISEFRRLIRVMFGRWLVVVGVVIIFLLILTAVFAPYIAPYQPNKQNLRLSIQPPSRDHWLGTDDLGRDQLSRIIFGSRIALMVGVVAVTVSGLIGMFLGLLAGYFGGWTETIIMRLVDALMAFPPIVLMLSIAAVLGGGLTNVMIAVGIGMIPTYCRLMCAQILSIKENDHILAANTIGASHLRVMFVHLVPNAFPSLLILFTLNMGSAILMEASLSFLGIGINPPTATWGSLINTGYTYLLTNPALSLAPGVAILLVVLAFNMVGDGLRDALDPRLRGKL
jgi:peptide/nickel transport system permease protein